MNTNLHIFTYTYINIYTELWHIPMKADGCCYAFPRDHPLSRFLSVSPC